MPEDNGQRTCIVIGAGGFLGSAVVAEAQLRGWRTIAVTRENYAHYRGTPCDLLVNANGNSKKFLARENPPLDFDLSVRSVHAVLHDFKPAMHVHLSTIDVYSDVKNPANNREDSPIDPDRLSPYGFHKLLAEQLVRHYAPGWLVLRLGGFVGPGLRKNSIHDMLSQLPLRVHPDSSYQYQDSRFVASLAFDLPARNCRNQIVNCAGDGLLSLREIAAMIPNYNLAAPPESAPAAPPERYEANIEKLKSLASVPRTRDTVAGFIARVVNGEEALA